MECNRVAIASVNRFMSFSRRLNGRFYGYLCFKRGMSFWMWTVDLMRRMSSVLGRWNLSFQMSTLARCN